MQLIQKPNYRHIVNVVGRIILEDADGVPVCSVVYSMAPARRATELCAQSGFYVAHHQNPDGVWVYRYARPRSAAQLPDECLDNYEPIVAPRCPTCGHLLEAN